MSVLDNDNDDNRPSAPPGAPASGTPKGKARSVRITFNEVAAKPADLKDGLIFAIRTDAGHATAMLKKNLAAALNCASTGGMMTLTMAVHEAYREWGHTVLSAMADCLDYERYGLAEDDRQKIDVHFYNAPVLAARAALLAKALPGPQDAGLPVVYVTLDEQIAPQDEHWAEISFSRLFDLKGAQNGAYMARPGKKPLPDQLADLLDKVKALKARHGRDIPIVLMEDNVRHAKMLNWVIELLDRHGVFQHARMAGISTCFCCAPESERRNIAHRGQIVPIAAVIDYGAIPVDVITPRDLLFDGFVVQANDKTSRLPGIFMDIEKLFKIRPDKVGQFHDSVMDANLDFCETIRDKFGIAPPLSWFAGADAIAHITNSSLDTPMEQIIRNCKAPPRAPAPPPSSAPPSPSSPPSSLPPSPGA
jgi:hypothetical protein